MIMTSEEFKRNWFEKKLTQDILLKIKIPKETKITPDLIKNLCLFNCRKKNKIVSDEYWHLNDYYTMPYLKEFEWLRTYVLDHWFVEYGFALSPLIDEKRSITALFQKQNQSINTHSHLDINNIKDSPEYSALYTASSGPKLSNVVFKYKDGRIQHGLWKIPLEPGFIIVFNSHLKHYITANENKEELINLAFNFQVVR